jgi:hypothetical protein
MITRSFSGLALAGLIVAGTAARAADGLDGLYVGVGDSSKLQCNGSTTKIEVRGQTATWEASHRAMGAISADGSVHISTYSGKGAPVDIDGRLDGDYFTGQERETVGADPCVWRLHLKRSAVETGRMCREGCKGWQRAGDDWACTELTWCRNKTGPLTGLDAAPAKPKPR